MSNDTDDVKGRSIDNLTRNAKKGVKIYHFLQNIQSTSILVKIIVVQFLVEIIYHEIFKKEQQNLQNNMRLYGPGGSLD